MGFDSLRHGQQCCLTRCASAAGDYDGPADHPQTYSAGGPPRSVPRQQQARVIPRNTYLEIGTDCRVATGSFDAESGASSPLLGGTADTNKPEKALGVEARNLVSLQGSQKICRFDILD
jgi:hypothetical protein